jgi:hypothetical protein
MVDTATVVPTEAAAGEAAATGSAAASPADAAAAQAPAAAKTPVIPAATAGPRPEAPSGESTKQPLTLADCIDLAMVISRMSGKKLVSDEFQRLKDDVEDHREVVSELEVESKDALSTTPISKQLSSRVEKMLRNVEASLDKASCARLGQAGARA